jgi:hypothetical protein
MSFQGVGRRTVTAKFDADRISTDGGVLLLREVAAKTKLLEKFARCFQDHRDQDLIEHSVLDLTTQRVFGLCCGYEDLNDHDHWRMDPILMALYGKEEGLASRSTLNRLELTPNIVAVDARYHKIAYNEEAIDKLFVDFFLDSLKSKKKLKKIILDLDATDNTLHGKQEGRHFSGYYDEYCYLPLYIFCGHELVSAKLRLSSEDPAVGACDDIKRIIPKIRRRFPEVRIIIRGDSGFCRDNILSWCEANDVDYIIGLAKNRVLERKLGRKMKKAKRKFLKRRRAKPDEDCPAVRLFASFGYKTIKSWSCKRRVIGKAEHSTEGANPRFIVTTLTGSPKRLYADVYCQRGNMELRIKEQQLYLFGDRSSAHPIRANQLRIYFSAIAYVLMHTLRRLALRKTELKSAQVSTMRLKLLKIAATVTSSVRRVVVHLASSYPFKNIFQNVLRNLQSAHVT